jgi:serine/threonine protein kinase
MCSQVVHGDIKLDNIVITKDLKNVAICDFGTAGISSRVLFYVLVVKLTSVCDDTKIGRASVSSRRTWCRATTALPRFASASGEHLCACIADVCLGRDQAQQVYHGARAPLVAKIHVYRFYSILDMVIVTRSCIFFSRPADKVCLYTWFFISFGMHCLGETICCCSLAELCILNYCRLCFAA